MDNPKVFVKETPRHGRGVFAKQKIKTGELIASFDGTVYDWDFDDWTDDLYNHVIQFHPRKWRDSKGIARLLNHSCEPNCGIQNLFDIVAMRDIKKGEEITWDYEMTENYRWRMNCSCGTASCRKKIGAYKYMPETVRQKYKGFISEWLLIKKV